MKVVVTALAPFRPAPFELSHPSGKGNSRFGALLHGPGDVGALTGQRALSSSEVGLFGAVRGPNVSGSTPSLQDAGPLLPQPPLRDDQPEGEAGDPAGPRGLGGWKGLPTTMLSPGASVPADLRPNATPISQAVPASQNDDMADRQGSVLANPVEASAKRPSQKRARTQAIFHRNETGLDVIMRIDNPEPGELSARIKDAMRLADASGLRDLAVTINGAVIHHISRADPWR